MTRVPSANFGKIFLAFLTVGFGGGVMVGVSTGTWGGGGGVIEGCRPGLSID